MFLTQVIRRSILECRTSDELEFTLKCLPHFCSFKISHLFAAESDKYSTDFFFCRRTWKKKLARTLSIIYYFSCHTNNNIMMWLCDLQLLWNFHAVKQTWVDLQVRCFHIFAAFKIYISEQTFWHYSHSDCGTMLTFKQWNDIWQLVTFSKLIYSTTTRVCGLVNLG